MNALYEASGLDPLHTSSQFVHFIFLKFFPLLIRLYSVLCPGLSVRLQMT